MKKFFEKIILTLKNPSSGRQLLFEEQLSESVPEKTFYTDSILYTDESRESEKDIRKFVMENQNKMITCNLFMRDGGGHVVGFYYDGKEKDIVRCYDSNRQDILECKIEEIGFTSLLTELKKLYKIEEPHLIVFQSYQEKKKGVIAKPKFTIAISQEHKNDKKFLDKMLCEATTGDVITQIPDAIEDLVKNHNCNPNLNVKGSYFNLKLIYLAASSGNLEIVKTLLANGAQLDYKDRALMCICPKIAFSLLYSSTREKLSKRRVRYALCLGVSVFSSIVLYQFNFSRCLAKSIE